MNVLVFLDETSLAARTRAADQATRLRNSGFAVTVQDGRAKRRATAGPVDAVYAIGSGRWRAARRTAKRRGVPIVYDHPPGCSLPAGLGTADAVVASGYTDAARLAALLATGRSAVVVRPPLSQATAIPARLRGRLGIGRGTIALQEALTTTRAEAEALVLAIGPLSDVHLVFLGGELWTDRAYVTELAGEAQATDRVHLIPNVASTRRVAYLNDADVGLTLCGHGDPPGVLPALDVFHALGVPFVAEAGSHSFLPADGITSRREPDALRAAICMASERPRERKRDDGRHLLQSVFVGVTARGGHQQMPTTVREQPLLPRLMNKARSVTADGGPATTLLTRAQVLRQQGEHLAAINAYRKVAQGAHPPAAVAAAAVGLARLNAPAEARAALEVVLDTQDRPPLATARAGEAAAALGDLPRARRLADAALATQDAPLPARRTASRVLEQVGEPSAALAVARRCGDLLSVARIEGALTSYDPAWQPARPYVGTPRPTRPGRIFTLLETSLPHARSGYTYRARTLLRAQREAGLDPIALTRLGFPVNRGLKAPTVEEVDGVMHYRASIAGVTRYTSVPMPEQIVENIRWAATLGRELAPEAIIATTPHLNGMVGLGLREELQVPLIYDVRGFPEMTWAVRNGGADAEVFGLRREAETRCMREADLVTTLSETMRRHIMSRGIDSDRVVVLPHAVDTDAFVPLARDDALAQQLGLAQRVVIGYISSLVPYEGVETLLEAIAIARDTDPRVAGLIVGDGELLASLKTQADQLGLAQHVAFTGRVDAADVARYYSLADVFVCPRHDHEVTRYVTPLKPFEAMSAGCCVAVSDLPTLREAVRDGECGALFPAGDPGALAATILALADDPNRCEELKAAARAHACANHDFANLRVALETAWLRVGLAPATHSSPHPDTAVAPLT